MKKFQGYKALIGCILAGFVTMGTSGTFGLMVPSIAAGCGTTNEMLYYAITVSTIVGLIANFLLAGIIKKIGARNAVLIAIVAQALNFVAIAVTKNATLVVVLGILGGIDQAFGGFATYGIVVNSWFVKDRNKYISLTTGLFLFGTPILTFIAGRTLVATGNYRTTYWIFTAILLVVGVVGALLLKSPEKCGQKPLGWSESTENEAESVSKNASDLRDGISFARIIRSPAFYLFFLCTALFAMGVDGLLSYAPGFWATHGMTESQYSGILSLAMVLLNAYIIVSGIVSEKLGNRVFVSFSAVCLAVGLFLMYLWPSSLSTPLLIGACVLIALGGPMMMSFANIIIPELFGLREFDRMAPIMGGAMWFGLSFSPFLLSACTAMFGDMRFFYLLYAVLTVVAFVLFLFAMATSPMAKLRKVEKAGVK